MEDWGVKVKYHHHEVGGCGQLEVEVELGEMTKMADNTMVAKYIIKNSAMGGRPHGHLPAQASGRRGRQRHACTYAAVPGWPAYFL